MTEPIAFGPFTLDARGKLLFRDGRPVALGTRAVSLLEALLGAGGEPVTKAALLDAAWPGLAVEESNLAVQVAALRKTLGLRPDGAEWIGTVPRVGYRMLAAPATPIAAADPVSPIPTLAVLPFDNLSGDVAENYLADGIVEDLTTALSRFRSFAVVARNSAFVFKGRAIDVRDAAKALGVRYAVQGSVRRGGGRLRIAAQLLDGTTGANLWAQQFDGRAEDVFDMQDGIVESVVGVVDRQIMHAEIARARRKAPESLEAYDLNLQALPRLYSLEPSDNEAAAVLLERAIALDPGFAMALVHAGWQIEHRISMGWSYSERDRDRMIDYADRALAAAPDDALVMAMVSEFYMVARLYDRALPLARRAAEMNPNHVFVLTCTAIVFMHLGDLDEAEAALGRAIRLSPHDPFGHGALSVLSHVRLMRRDYEGAIAWAERSLAINNHFGATHWMLIAANAHLGRLDEAHQLLAAYRITAPTVTLAGVRAGNPDRYPERPAVVIDGLRLAGMPEG